MEKFKSKSLLAKLALLGATLIWGSSFIFMKSTAEALPVFFLLFVRFSIACVTLSLIFIKLFKKIDKKYILYGFTAGLCLFCAYTVQTFGIIYTSPGKNAFLTAVYCVIVPFLYWITDKQKPDIFNIVAAFLEFIFLKYPLDIPSSMIDETILFPSLYVFLIRNLIFLFPILNPSAQK